MRQLGAATGMSFLPSARSRVHFIRAVGQVGGLGQSHATTFYRCSPTHVRVDRPMG